MAIKRILADDLKIGDIFTDITPGTNGGQYKVTDKGTKIIQAHPLWDKEGEQVEQFGWNEIVQIEVAK